MYNQNIELIDISENSVLQMMDDTSYLAEKCNAEHFASAAVAVRGSNVLADNIEF